MAPESFETRMEKARKLLAEQERQLEQLKQTLTAAASQVSRPTSRQAEDAAAQGETEDQWEQKRDRDPHVEGEEAGAPVAREAGVRVEQDGQVQLVRGSLGGAEERGERVVAEG